MDTSDSRSNEEMSEVGEEKFSNSGAMPDLIPYIQVAFRLLGVYFFVVGGSGIAEDLAGMILRWRRDLTERGDAMLFDYLTPPERFYGSAFYFAAGLYLLVGGHWLIQNVFSPASFLQGQCRHDNVEHDSE